MDMAHFTLGCIAPVPLCSELNKSLVAPLADMPTTSEASQANARLIVTDEGKYLLQGKTLGLVELDAALQSLKEAQPDLDLHVVGSAKATYEQVAPAMRLVQQHGLAKFGVVTGGNPSEEPAP
jgi:biopolymer transport protein ExbD